MEPALKEITGRLLDMYAKGEEYIPMRSQIRELLHDAKHWSNAFLDQLDLFLCRRWGAPRKELEMNFKRVLEQNEQKLSEEVKDELKRRLKQEVLMAGGQRWWHYTGRLVKPTFNLRKGRHPTDLSDAMIDLVDTLSADRDADDDGFVAQLWRTLSAMFMVQPSVDECAAWTCSNCTCSMYGRMIDSNFKMRISRCLLCGTGQRQNIENNLRGYDRYAMVIEGDAVEAADEEKKDDEDVKDDIDKLIERVIDEHQIDVRCPSQNSSAPCAMMMRLARVLVRYKQWLEALRSGS